MNESDDYILVVDDDPDVRAYLGSLLGHYNYSVITCQSAALPQGRAAAAPTT